MSSISISIVLYKTPSELLVKCLASYQKALAKLPATLKTEVILVNNSHDLDGDAIQQLLSTTVAYPVTYLASAKNGGYGYGHNLAIASSSATYHVVSNFDIYVDEEALVNAYHYLEQHPDVGLLSPDVYSMDNQRCYLCKQNPSFAIAIMRRLPPFLMNAWVKRRLAIFENRHLNYDQSISDYSFPTGCWMFFRTRVLKALNGFDEGYFLYCEDADIGRRLLTLAKMVYLPSVKCQHEWQRASRHSWRLLLTHARSTWRYHQKFKTKP